MVTINVITSENKIRGVVSGTPFEVPFTNENLEDLNAFKDSIESIFPLQTKEDKESLKELIDQFHKSVKEMNSNDVPLQSKDFPEFVVDSRGRYRLQHNGVISSLIVPEEIMDDIRASKDKGLSYEPIIKFLVRLYRNPNMRNKDREAAQKFFNEVCSYVTQTFVSPSLKVKYEEEYGYTPEKAEEFATVRQTPYTAEGLIVTKKVVKPVKEEYVLDEDGNTVSKPLYKTTSVDPVTGEPTDNNEPIFSEDWKFLPEVMGTRGDAFHCGSRGLGHIIVIGEETRLDDWSQVDCDPNNSCVKGLHFGNQDYVDSWETPRNVTLNYFIDPAYIGAIPYNDVSGVMRCLRGFPYSIKDREVDNRNLYHSSDYAKKLDSEWEAEKAEAVRLFQMEKEELDKLINEVNAF